jgi:hypothetical protein
MEAGIDSICIHVFSNIVWQEAYKEIGIRVLV